MGSAEGGIWQDFVDQTSSTGSSTHFMYLLASQKPPLTAKLTANAFECPLLPKPIKGFKNFAELVFLLVDRNL